MDSDRPSAAHSNAGIQCVFHEIGQDGHKVHIGHPGLLRRVRLRGKRHADRLCLVGIGAQKLVDHSVRTPRGEALDRLLSLFQIVQDALGVPCPGHGGNAGVMMALVVPDSPALLLRPTDGLHIARQIFHLLLDQCLLRLLTHMDDVADAQNSDRRKRGHRYAEHEQRLDLHAAIQPYS